MCNLSQRAPQRSEARLKLPEHGAAEVPGPRFTPSQVQDLQALGVSAAQINRLEQAMRLIAPLFQPRATMRDVRDQLDELTQALDSAVSHLTEMERRARVLPASEEALELLAEAAEQSELPGGEFRSQLRGVQAVAHRAAELLPKRQRGRPRAGSGSPVALINTALVQGWEGQHGPSRRGFKNLGQHLRESPFPPSRSPDSPFRKIVELCFGALQNEHDANAEAAIKSFLRHRKKPAQKD